MLFRKPKIKIIEEMKFKRIQDMSDKWRSSFGDVSSGFVMLVWGQSGNGKSNFVMQLIKELTHTGSILYVSLEEGITASLQGSIRRAFPEATGENRNIHFADHSATYEKMMLYLKKRNTEKIIIIDSLQYWGIDYRQYCRMKEAFPRKSFIFISHASGKLPDGKTADKIRYDAMIKVHVQQFVAFVKSRYGGNKPYLIWEQGAIAHYGKKQLAKILKGE